MELQVRHKRLGVMTIKYSHEDFNYVKSHKWRIADEKGKLYAITIMKVDGNWRSRKMHRLITSCPTDKMVDHKDGDTLNNTRENLRICSNKQNCRNSTKSKANTTGYKGVIKDSRDLKNKYRAQIMVDYKCKKLGYFQTPQAAAIAYNEAAKQYFGEFANLNNV